MNIAVQYKGVSCKFGSKPVLDNLSLDVEEGAIVGVLGPNGAGKTTLLSLALGLHKQFTGELSVLGAKMPESSSRLRRQIGVVLQETALYDELTTYENLEFAASLYNVTDGRKRIEEVLELLMLAPRAKQIVRTLSGGLRRRVAIARALLHDPQLLIIDEPTLGVDVEARHAIWSHLRLLKAKGRTTMVATNYLDEAQALCDKVAVLRSGSLLCCETSERLLARAGHCLDVECTEDEGQFLANILNDSSKGVMRVDKVPGGLTVFLDGNAMSKDIMNTILQNSQASGFRLRAPDLIEIFKALEGGMPK